jgi:serine/threonine-protein kinase
MTPEYAAPEQVRGEPVSTATDVYALGTLLYELLAGERPFAGEGSTLGALERAILEEDPTPPSKVASRERALRGDLDAIVMKALRKEPERRYPSVEALGADIRRHLAGQPVLASGGRLAYRAGKFLRRHRLGVGAAALLLLFLVGGLVATTWQAKEARREADRAKAVQDFLVSLFKVSDPAESKGEKLTARQILDRGAARIDRELAGQPEVQAMLWRVISDVYLEFSDYAAAASLLKKAIPVEERTHGSGSLEVARSKAALAIVLSQHERSDEADRLSLEALPILRAQLGEEHPEVADALDVHAGIRYGLNDFAGAEALRRRALAICTKVFGDEAAECLHVRHNLGVLLSHAGRSCEAREPSRRAAQIARKRLGLLHPRTLAFLDALAASLLSCGEWGEGERIVRETFPLKVRALHRVIDAVQVAAGELDRVSLVDVQDRRHHPPGQLVRADGVRRPACQARDQGREQEKKGDRAGDQPGTLGIEAFAWIHHWFQVLPTPPESFQEDRCHLCPSGAANVAAPPFHFRVTGTQSGSRGLRAAGTGSNGVQL